MSSYYPSFNYMGKNSFDDKNLIVVHFESGDSGECGTFLDMEPVYTEGQYGIKRQIYGAKYNSVAVIRISVMKANGSDFSVSEVRDFLKWTTGARSSSYLDLVDDANVVVSFLGHVTSVYQQKLDARTIGFTIEYTSVSPWAYSSIQNISCVNNQSLEVDASTGLLSLNPDDASLTDDGLLTNVQDTMFYLTEGGKLYVRGRIPTLAINNPSDDVYSYVYMDTKITSISCDTNIEIENKTLDEKTTITDIDTNEIITLSSNQFIVSDKPNKKFGYTFNYVWPKLGPGVNEIMITGDGRFIIEFTYRYPIKIGDCAMDIDVNNTTMGCCGDYGPSGNKNNIYWSDILDLPTTIGGYGITDAYTMTEVDNKLVSVDPTVDANALNSMLDNTLQ